MPAEPNSSCGLALADRSSGTTSDNQMCLELKLMESNITDQQYSGADLQLSEPHFDDEATVLSARPVVPLHKVRAGARSGRRLGFALAILVALLVGAFGATLIYQQRGQKEEIAIAESASLISEPAVQEGSVAGASGSAVDLNESAPSIAEDTNAGTKRQAHHAPAPTHAKKPAPKVLRNTPAGREMNRQNEATNQEGKREIRRAELTDERLDRKAKRQAKRDAGGQKRQPADDLLRIREIFEGPRRP